MRSSLTRRGMGEGFQEIQELFDQSIILQSELITERITRRISLRSTAICLAFIMCTQRTE